MTDNLTKAQRRHTMRRVKAKDTGPEMIVRRLIHAAGYRYRLHRANLPGKPDLVFPGRKKVIFVHGCFWHQHPGCKAADRPAGNREYWDKKLDRTVVRDRTNLAKLEEMGWQVLVVWECTIKDREDLARRLIGFLES